MNVYKLSSIEQSVQYLHSAAGFLRNTTQLKAIQAGNYVTWPLFNIKNVNKYFPESEVTQKGHMKQVRQGVRSMKPKEGQDK